MYEEKKSEILGVKIPKKWVNIHGTTHKLYGGFSYLFHIKTLVILINIYRNTLLSSYMFTLSSANTRSAVTLGLYRKRLWMKLEPWRHRFQYDLCVRSYVHGDVRISSVYPGTHTLMHHLILSCTTDEFLVFSMTYTRLHTVLLYGLRFLSSGVLTDWGRRGETSKSLLLMKGSLCITINTTNITLEVSMLI